MSLILPNGLLKLQHRRVAIFDAGRHRLAGDVHQFARLVGGLDFVAGRGDQALHHVLAGVRRVSGQDFVQDRAQQVGVAGRSDAVDLTGRQLGRHVGGRAAHARRLQDAVGLAKGRRSHGDPPVHHQDFTEIAEHDILGLQVPMHDAAYVGKGDRVRNAHQNAEVLDQRFLGNDLVPRRAVDPFHRVE